MNVFFDFDQFQEQAQLPKVKPAYSKKQLQDFKQKSKQKKKEKLIRKYAD
jgi:hypothetical protein